MKQKYYIPVVIALTLFISCDESKKIFSSSVNFAKVEVEKNSGNSFVDSAYHVIIQYYNPVDAPAYLQDSILKYTKLLFASWFDVSCDFDLDNSVKNHRDEYVKLAKENNLSGYHVFNLKITPEDVYQNDRIISFTYNWFLYESGARGNFGKYCFVVQKDDGSKPVFEKLLKDDVFQDFLKLAETEFKEQAGMKAGETMCELYRFKNNTFHLNSTFAFTTQGLVFYYNPHEIAPYSAGLIKLVLPYEKIKDYLKIEN